MFDVISDLKSFFLRRERDIFDKGIFFICFFQSFKIYFTIWSILTKTGFYHSIIWFEEEVKLKMVFWGFFVEKSKMSHSSSPTILQHHKKLLKLKSISLFQLKKIQFFQIRFVLKLAFLKRYFSNINYHNSVSRKMYCICIPKKKKNRYFF